MNKIIIIALMCISINTTAKYASQKIEEITIARAIKNIENKMKTSSKKSNRYKFSLARLYSMVAASGNKSVKWQSPSEWPIITSSDSPGGYSYGRFTPLKSIDKPRVDELTKAIALYEELIKDKEGTHEVLLSYGWTLIQANKKKQAQIQLLKILEKNLKSNSNLLTPIQLEAVNYLATILTKENRHFNRIQSLKSSHKMKRRMSSPIALSFDQRLTRKLWTTSEHVLFDLDGTGPRIWNWLNTNVAWLVFKPNSGKVTGDDLFGNVTFQSRWHNGYDALCSLDDNNDNKLSHSELKGIGLWFDLNSNGLMENNEFGSLKKYQIKELSCQYEVLNDKEFWNPRGATLNNGNSLSTIDLVLEEQIIK